MGLSGWHQGIEEEGLEFLAMFLSSSKVSLGGGESYGLITPTIPP